ncbi:protein S-acyltransferase 11 [Selaginella moellendorffii]|nr:protein S-acyltransferase 11 [Selaginella moellendorffii]|eukprot:XP_024533860.1 protein S-acyltransferase 11 [Selaginella moellendorffii]
MDVEAPPADPGDAIHPSLLVTSADDGSREWESQCWGCSSYLILPFFSEAFKCGWCGAVTLSKPRQRSSQRWRRCATIRDWSLVAVVLMIIALVTGGGIWTVYPVLYPQPTWSGCFHIFIALSLAGATLASYSLAAFTPAGALAKVPWGSLQPIGKSALDGYTYCAYCECPKPPQAHHCRTCGTCVMDMDHHCPFIGNCVGAHNHPHFILFLVYATISSCYVLLMSVLAGLAIWPPLLQRYQGSGEWGLFHSVGTILAASFLEAFEEFEEDEDKGLPSVSARSLALIYLVITAMAILIGLALLLRQQIQLLYAGQTYLESIQAGDGELLRPGWHNLRRLFGKKHPALWLLPGFTSKGSYLKLQ